jgi:hypothetical protein
VLPDGISATQTLFEAFLGEQSPAPAAPRELAAQMARLARMLRTTIAEALANDTSSASTSASSASGSASDLASQFDSFRTVLLHALTPAEFADMYAQTIAYGLFAARCNHHAAKGTFTRESAVFEIPKTNPFLRTLFSTIAGADLDDRLAWVVDSLAGLLHRTDIAAILQDFGKRTRQEDPVVHFYETFLSEYDPALREMRGVYYTPEPIVSYIVRSVDALLKGTFGIKQGLADSTTVSVQPTQTASNKTHPLWSCWGIRRIPTLR